MNLKFLLFIFFFLSAQVLSSQEKWQQDIAEVLNLATTDAQKIILLENLTIKYRNNNNAPALGKVYAELGVLYFKNKDKAKSITALSKSISILQPYKHSPFLITELNRSRSNLVWIYRMENNSSKQRWLLNEMVKDNVQDQYTFNAHINLALLDATKGDYYVAIQRLNLLLSQKNDVNNEILLRNNLVKILAFMTEVDSEKSLHHYKKLILKQYNFVEANFSKSTLEENLHYEFYNNLANIFESWKENEKARRLYEKCKQFYKIQNKKQEYFLVLNNIGYLYAKQNNIQKASECFQEIINHSSDDNQIATGLDNLGYFSNIKPEHKILYFQKALQTILEKKDVPYELPDLKSIFDSGYQQDILVYLLDLANGYVQCHKKTKQKSYLLEAKETLYRIDAMVSLIRYESTSDQSKLFWIEKGVNAYLLATEVSYLLQQPEDAFYFMEKNKALLLQENIKKYQQKMLAQIPENLLQTELKLQQELLLLEKDYLQFPSDNKKRSRYFQKNNSYEKYRKRMLLQYPTYQHAKHKIDIVTLQNVVQSLQPEECFVSYIINKQGAYGLFVSPKEKILFSITDIMLLQKNINTLQNFATKFTLHKNEKEQFQMVSNAVFHSLFPFKDAFQKLNNKKLTIVGEDLLLHFPFESLLVDSKPNLKDNYLINFTEINYLHSFSVFQKIKNWDNKTENSVLAIFPNEFKNNKLNRLTRTKELHEFLERYTGSFVLEENKATKENFKINSKNYSIIHINSHAGINAKNGIPWIAFQKDNLYISDLYGISNHADLVILDACKTNDGEMYSGEGVMSLSRAFFSNGTKSVISSLWNVNEKASNEIIKSFYENLEKGVSKSKALQLAKISYLKKHQLSEILPYHWASFVLTGDTTSVVLHKKWYYCNNNNVLILLGFLSILVAVLLLKFKIFRK